ncbi:Kazal-type serine protease inhibitor domain-containing protein [Toxoplasma gondii TgCatPRC2]|uniref:Kazal-type serine protease inhibitor domain-containing protein n=14 Tax=Toxoplasma gondii TaxID=5811 RepID=A0A125YW10_TOXGV|nr:Kazal-type serine protease inhibitor domain-containing protein [Toxoplasma gondii ME49]EPR59278.1 Kazal-type serine protease inhibitor domain-containing protein [Toxoplasma gondii GT1]ESS30520.1 Kazal-type serine protease inhibitor domain-containing protein [Toxoplasma gondii VEG]KAF4643981.1 Kazal-type serine protease inhibitor domain-containing protein [Toxoplasma gondii]KFG28206.1 Kazal-type serine protease inhibitor domain-containing protein [Toxoplasma gondii p89]KFG30099.1 Kazal-type |eukprot:XP_002369106.1 Kazal-type serine protease inhibitor domain-containing protein [Toxoplasma gondii ME49]
MNRPLKKVACIILLGKGYLCAGRAQVLDEFGENAYNDVYEGECDCPPDIHIVCGRNGQEYINPCYAMCDGTTVDAAGHCATFQLHELL